MSEYAKCWVNDLGERQWQPIVGKYGLWNERYGLSRWSEWDQHHGPFLHKWRWQAVRRAKKAEKRWAANSWSPCEGKQ